MSIWDEKCTELVEVIYYSETIYTNCNVSIGKMEMSQVSSRESEFTLCHTISVGFYQYNVQLNFDIITRESC